MRWVAPLVLVALAVGGCPTEKPAYSPAIMVDKTTLDFGTTQTSMTFTVRNVWTTVPLPQFTVTVDQLWASVNPTTGNSTGPDDLVTITVTVDRSLMVAGSGAATVYITAPGVAQKTVAILAESLLSASFTVDSTQPFAGDPATFSDTSTAAASSGAIVNWAWDFGDGGTSTAQNPVHTYAAAGTYTVRLTVNTATLSATATRTGYMTVRIKVGPTAEFSASTTQPVATLSNVQFIDLSTPGTAPITDWLWDFGDSTTSTAQNPSHIYTIQAVYVLYFDVLLRVTTAHGLDEELKLGYIALVPAPPKADFSASTRNPQVNEDVQFFDDSDPGSGAILSWLWDFGDGETSTAQHPSHVYTTAGAFTVSRTVTTEIGSDEETRTDYITVQAILPTIESAATPLDP